VDGGCLKKGIATISASGGILPSADRNTGKDPDLAEVFQAIFCL
jgi:hypothetical protein